MWISGIVQVVNSCNTTTMSPRVVVALFVGVLCAGCLATNTDDEQLWPNINQEIFKKNMDAIKKLDAKEDGIFKAHNIDPDKVAAKANADEQNPFKDMAEETQSAGPVENRALGFSLNIAKQNLNDVKHYNAAHTNQAAPAGHSVMGANAPAQMQENQQPVTTPSAVVSTPVPVTQPAPQVHPEMGEKSTSLRGAVTDQQVFDALNQNAPSSGKTGFSGLAEEAEQNIPKTINDEIVNSDVSSFNSVQADSQGQENALQKNVQMGEKEKEHGDLASRFEQLRAVNSQAAFQSNLQPQAQAQVQTQQQAQQQSQPQAQQAPEPMPSAWNTNVNSAGEHIQAVNPSTGLPVPAAEAENVRPTYMDHAENQSGLNSKLADPSRWYGAQGIEGQPSTKKVVVPAPGDIPPAKVVVSPPPVAKAQPQQGIAQAVPQQQQQQQQQPAQQVQQTQPVQQTQQVQQAPQAQAQQQQPQAEATIDDWGMNDNTAEQQYESIVAGSKASAGSAVQQAAAQPQQQPQQQDGGDDDDEDDGMPVIANFKNAVELGEKNFDQYISKSPNTVVEWYAPWCPHCRDFAPEMDKVASYFNEQAKDKKISVARVNVDANEKLADRFGVDGFPRVMYFREGMEQPNETETYDGDRVAGKLEEWACTESGELTNCAPAGAGLEELTANVELTEKPNLECSRGDKAKYVK